MNKWGCAPRTHGMPLGTVCMSLLLGAVCQACVSVLPAPPPAMSAAKFVRGPSTEGGGKVSASGAVGIVKDFYPTYEKADEGTDFYAPASEGAGTFHLARRYDLAVTFGSWKATVEGNGVVLDLQHLRLGILHGVGTGFWAQLTEDEHDNRRDWKLQYDLSAGLIAELPFEDSGAGFAAFKYTYGNDFVSEPAEEGEQETGMAATHYFTANLGWLFRVGALQVSPELAVSRCSYAGDSEPLDFGEGGSAGSTWYERGYWLFLAGASIAAPF